MDDLDGYTIAERITTEARARIDAAIAEAFRRESEHGAYNADDVAQLYREAR